MKALLVICAILVILVVVFVPSVRNTVLDFFQPRPALMYSSGNIPLKIVVRQDNTLIYTDRRLSNTSSATADQWSTYFVWGKSDTYYVASPYQDRVPDPPYYFRSEQIFEWPSYIALSFYTSPDQSGRDPVHCYESLNAAQKAQGSMVFEEKPKHDTTFQPMNAQPILSEASPGIYYLASLYDDHDGKGGYVFLGHYAFGYCRYDQRAHQFRRYVNRVTLEQQMKVLGKWLTGQTTSSNTMMNPEDLNQVYGGASDMIAPFAPQQRGIQAIMNAFKSSDLPSDARGKLFSNDLMTGGDPAALRETVQKVYGQMKSYYNDDSMWNSDGYSFVPAEWF